MPLTTCAGADFVFGTNPTSSSGEGPQSTNQGPGIPIDQPVIRGGVINSVLTGATLTPPSFYVRLWMCSGRAGTAVKEILIASLEGQVALGAVSERAIAANTILPSVGRPFNGATDSFTAEWNVGGTAGDGIQRRAQTQVCNPTGEALSCCDQVLAEVLAIKAFVSKQFPPAGLP